MRRLYRHICVAAARTKTSNTLKNAYQCHSAVQMMQCYGNNKVMEILGLCHQSSKCNRGAGQVVETNIFE